MPSFVKGLKIGDQLKAARIERRLSVQELARQTGLHPTTLYHLEWNQAQPSMGTLRALDDTLGRGWDKKPAA